MNNNLKADQSGLVNRLWFFAGLAILFLIFFGLTKEIVNRRQIIKQISDDQAEIAVLKAENSVLNDKVNNWNVSGELELNARVKLGLEKPGEQTIIINRSNPAAANGLAVKSNQEVINLTGDNPDDAESNAIKWWKYFFQ